MKTRQLAASAFFLSSLDLASPVGATKTKIRARDHRSLFLANNVDCSTNSTDSADSLVFTINNLVNAQNDLLVYCRDSATANLEFGGSIPTGGLGSEAVPRDLDPFGGNDPITMSKDETCLFAVNAGSDTISSFKIDGLSVTRVGVYPSGGLFPMSVATRTGNFYVLNGGGDGNVATFALDDGTCTLSILEDETVKFNFGNTNPPNAFPGPAVIGVTPDENTLIFINKGTVQSMIYTYPINPADGTLGRAAFTVSNGFTPFSIDFDKNANLIVVEVNAGATLPPSPQSPPPPNAGGASSYRFTPFGTLEVISGSVLNNQGSSCWAAVVGDCYFTANTSSGNISAMTIAANGSLFLKNDVSEDGVVAANILGAQDLYAVGDTLYALSSDPKIYAFTVDKNFCLLTPTGPAFSEGLPAYQEVPPETATCAAGPSGFSGFCPTVTGLLGTTAQNEGL